MNLQTHLINKFCLLIAYTAMAVTLPGSLASAKSEPARELPPASNAKKRMMLEFLEKNQNEDGENVVIVPEKPKTKANKLSKKTSVVKFAEKESEFAPAENAASGDFTSRKSAPEAPLAPQAPKVGAARAAEARRARLAIDEPTESPIDRPVARPVTQPTFQQSYQQKNKETVSPVTQRSSAVIASDRDSNSRNPKRFVSARAGYIDAQYSSYDSRMKNGATTLGVGVLFRRPVLDVTLAVDYAHALDQAIGLSNARMALTHVALSKSFGRSEQLAKPFIGIGIGLIDVTVQSFHQQTNSIYLLEHQRGTYGFIKPMLGGQFGRERITVNLSLEYLAISGGSELTHRLGGWSTQLSAGLAF